MTLSLAIIFMGFTGVDAFRHAGFYPDEHDGHRPSQGSELQRGKRISHVLRRAEFIFVPLVVAGVAAFYQRDVDPRVRTFPFFFLHCLLQVAIMSCACEMGWMYH